MTEGKEIRQKRIREQEKGKRWIRVTAERGDEKNKSDGGKKG